MSLLRLSIARTTSTLSRFLSPVTVNKLPESRHISATASHFCEHHEKAEDEDKEERIVDPAKVRSVKVDVLTSIRYLKSNAFKETYGDKLVWQLYRRNHKGNIAPRKTRKSCIKGGLLATASPCPICRDQYLVLHHSNVALLHQFTSEYTGELYTYEKTGLCQKAHRDLVIAYERAHDRGLIQKPIAHRHYNYEEFYPSLKN